MCRSLGDGKEEKESTMLWVEETKKIKRVLWIWQRAGEKKVIGKRRIWTATDSTGP